MTNAVTTNTSIKTTVHIDWTTSQVIRIVANQDMPEYGVKARQTVYLVRSSANNGEYYILVWGDRKATGWGCPCKGHEVYGKCRHCVLANQHSRNRAKRITIQKAAQEQAKKERWVSYKLACFFQALYVHAEQQLKAEQQVQVIAANSSAEKLVKVAPKPAIASNVTQPSRYDAPLRGSGATGFGVQARLAASRKIASSVPMR